MSKATELIERSILEGKDALEHLGYADYIKERDRRISNTGGTP